MPAKITKCNECGSSSFWATEIQYHSANTFNEPGKNPIVEVNGANGRDCHTTEFFCQDCNKRYDESEVKYTYI